MDKIKVGSIIIINWSREPKEIRVVTKIVNGEIWNVGLRNPPGFFHVNNDNFALLLCE